SAAELAAEMRAIAAASGFGEPSDEARAYFADSDGFVRARMPAVVTAVVRAAQHAIGQTKLPRAIALADRATSLAPDDPAVITLVERVTAGGRASRRRRVWAALAGATLLAGGAGAVALTGRGTAAPADAAMRATRDAFALALAMPDAALALEAPPP